LIDTLENPFLVDKLVNPFFLLTQIIDMESLQKRLLKVSYVPKMSSAGLYKLLFLLAAINSTNEASKAGGMRH
jgi:hypothetical protein